MNLYELMERFIADVAEKDPYEGGACYMDDLLEDIRSRDWHVVWEGKEYRVELGSLVTEENCYSCDYYCCLNQQHYCGIDGIKNMRTIIHPSMFNECPSFKRVVNNG